SCTPQIYTLSLHDALPIYLPLLDEFAELTDLALRVGTSWSAVRTLRDELERSRMDAREKSARLDLIAFQLGEIERASPRPAEDRSEEHTSELQSRSDLVCR